MPTSQIRDNGWHHFTLSLMPYDGAEALPQLSLAATALNQAPPSVAGKVPLGQPPFGLRIEGGPVELVCAKPRFDGKPGVVLRLLNHGGKPTCAILAFSGPTPKEICSCDMTERVQTRLRPTGNRLTLSFKSFENRTVRVD